MASIQQRSFPSSVASLYFKHQKKPMTSPISPTYSSFSVPSPFSSASSVSFPNENSPISDSHFENIPSPIDADVAVYSASSVQVQMFSPQGDIAAAYAPDFDYGMMALSSNLKKQQVPFVFPLPSSHLLSSHRLQQQVHSLLREGSFNKSMNTVYIPAPVPPQRHGQLSPQALVRSSTHPSSLSHRQSQQHQAHSHQLLAQQSLPQQSGTAHMSTDIMFEVDLDEWNNSANMHLHNHSNSGYPAASLDSQSSRLKQDDSMLYSAGMNGFMAAMAGPQHQQHLEVQNQFFDVTPSIIPPQSAESTVPQARNSSRYSHFQQQPHQPASNFYSPTQLPRLHFGTQQQYITVHPAEVSPDTCPSNSPLHTFNDLATNGIEIPDGCDPGDYMCPTDMPPGDDLKGSLGMDMGLDLTMGSSNMQSKWSGDRKDVDGDLADLDAEGEEVDPSDIEQSYGSLPGGPSALQTIHSDDGEEDAAVDDITDESRLSEEESSTDSDDSEFIPGSRQRGRRRRPQSTLSSSYPSYGYTEGRSLRTRSGTRYTPYPNGYSTDNGADSLDQQTYDEFSQSGRSKRYIGSSSTAASSDGANDYLNFTTLSASAGGPSRRRPRPSNSLPVPIPVPNLTKKSRGRRVPTASSLEDLRSASSGAGRKRQNAGKGARMYFCDVEGCGKCFARGEHLKRHIRSIHTYEKPHSCPYAGCNKDFSRHDNLRQHMRVHKDLASPPTA